MHILRSMVFLLCMLVGIIPTLISQPYTSATQKALAAKTTRLFELLQRPTYGYDGQHDYIKRDLAEMEQLLVEGADANGRNDHQITPLDLAIVHRSPSMVKKLIDFNADVTSADRHGYTPLGKAVAAANPSIVKILLDAGANPHGRQTSVGTPLAYAGHYGLTDVAFQLLNAGATDDERAEALAYAQERAKREPEKAEVANLLLYYPHHHKKLHAPLKEDGGVQELIANIVDSIKNYAAEHKIAATTLAASVAAALTALIYAKGKHVTRWQENPAYQGIES